VELLPFAVCLLSALLINLFIVSVWLLVPEKYDSVNVLQLGRWYLLSIVAIVVGGWIGCEVVRKINTARYRQAVYCVLLLAGVTQIFFAL